MTPYYMVVASLPHLEALDVAERLPITRERLDQRLRNLSLEHQTELAGARRLVEWRHQPLSRSDADVIAMYGQVMGRLGDRALREFVAFRMDQRTVMAAMRRRQDGQGVPVVGEAWGISPRSEWLRRHWDEPDFGLRSHYPWVDAVRRSLEQRSALEVERLLMDVVWRRLGRLADASPFAFPAVFAFVFKWDILNRWLSYQPDMAIGRFRELVTEGLGDYHEHSD